MGWNHSKAALDTNGVEVGGLRDGLIEILHKLGLARLADLGWSELGWAGVIPKHPWLHNVCNLMVYVVA